MIPLRDQEVIRQRFEQELTGRVRIDYFSQRQSKIIVPGRQECVHCEDVRTMLDEISHLSPRISLSIHELADESRVAAELGVDKVPGIVVRGQANRPVRFAGIPAGSQFPDFIDTIIEASRGSADLKPETLRQLKKLKDEVTLQVFVVPGCPHSPAVARLAFKLGLQSPHVKAEVIEVTEFPSLAQRLGLRATPTTLIDQRLLIAGALDETTMLHAIFKAADGKPIAANEFKPGPATPLQLVSQEQASQSRPATTASGLILPR